ncbi:PRC-barrel domain-containing protein [Nocardia sp. NPDC019395]|uniref:PRC-barrel domain-containing protein n=1 Tax=Nocardia sp. NPDC019395 TaxID=3154686 RepID=UPI0033CF1D60
MAQQVGDLIGDAVYDVGGDKIGKVKRVYVDNVSGAATWASVSTGFFRDDSLVPLAGAQLYQDSGELQVRVHKEAVRTAPHLEHDGLISQESEDELFVHYGFDPGGAGRDDYGRHAAQPGGGAMAAGGAAAGAGGMPEPRTEPEPIVRRPEQERNIGSERQEAGWDEESVSVERVRSSADGVEEEQTFSDTVRRGQTSTEDIDRDDNRR